MMAKVSCSLCVFTLLFASCSAQNYTTFAEDTTTTGSETTVAPSITTTEISGENLARERAVEDFISLFKANLVKFVPFTSKGLIPNTEKTLGEKYNIMRSIDYDSWQIKAAEHNATHFKISYDYVQFSVYFRTQSSASSYWPDNDGILSSKSTLTATFEYEFDDVTGRIVNASRVSSVYGDADVVPHSNAHMPSPAFLEWAHKYLHNGFDAYILEGVMQLTVTRRSMDDFIHLFEANLAKHISGNTTNMISAYSKSFGHSVNRIADISFKAELSKETERSETHFAIHFDEVHFSANFEVKPWISRYPSDNSGTLSTSSKMTATFEFEFDSVNRKVVSASLVDSEYGAANVTSSGEGGQPSGAFFEWANERLHGEFDFYIVEVILEQTITTFNYQMLSRLS